MWHWLFIKEKNNQYIILKDEQVTGEVRWMLERDGYELIWDSARSYKAAAEEAKSYYLAKQLKLETRPITFKDASSFINQHHRHHISPQGHKFSISLYDGDLIVGVVTAGRPVSRHRDDGLTLEITRCCIKEAYKNGISQLYSAACKAANAMGYRRVITYTLVRESGISLRASGFQKTNIVQGRTWNSKTRIRVDKHPIEDKVLWLRNII